ncbi:winged helix-turn-helix domain-containing protein [Kitasatospora sp. NPDC002040]|uniref:winged helix-turn-helix domain-containing protein n=1 Tax=Kitasatospora sp. NPDC002040 TaxID=3154661 RepID=UPI00331FCC0F
MAPRQQPASTAVTDALRTRITAGEWPPGTSLPSRAALAAEYGVSDAVLQRAQETLIRDGLLEGQTGSGTYVPEDRPRHQLHLDADARFGVRPAPAGHWAPLCRRDGPLVLAYFVQDRPLLLARPGGQASRSPAAGYRARAASAGSEDAQVLGLLQGEAVTLIEYCGAAEESTVLAPGRLWDLLLP